MVKDNTFCFVGNFVILTDKYGPLENTKNTFATLCQLNRSTPILKYVKIYSRFRKNYIPN